MSRTLKRLVIGTGFLVIFGFIALGIYQQRREEPTCSDNIQNQGEEGIDCGFVCDNVCLEKLEPLEITKSNLIKVSEKEGKWDYDVLAYLYNPNTSHGASEIEYEISLFDINNAIVLRKRNLGYILPGQTKHIYEPLLRTSREAKRVELKITKVEWEKLRGIAEEDLNFLVRYKEFIYGQKPGIFGFVRSAIFNPSDFSFDKVDVIVMIYKGNTLLGANRTDLRTFISKTERMFEADWINPLLVVPDRIDIEIGTNVFRSDNFVKNYNPEEKFQQLH